MPTDRPAAWKTVSAPKLSKRAIAKATAETKASTDRYNARVRAEHANLRLRILALRPDWSAERLEEVRHTYSIDSTDPGLAAILAAVEAADALAARFARSRVTAV